MKKLFFLSLCILSSFFGTTCIAQQDFNNYDSLKRVLELAKHDSTRLKALAKLCEFNMFTRPDSSFYYGYQGLAISRQINDADTEVKLLRNMGTAQNSLGNFAKGLQLTLQAMRIAEEKNILHEKALLLMILGGSFSKEEFSKRLDFLKQAANLLDSLQEFPFAANTQNYIAIAYLEKKQLDSATYYNQLARVKAEPLKIWWVNYRIFLTMGTIEQTKGNYDLAIEHFRSALSSAGTSIGYFDTNLAMAKLFQETNELDSCNHYALQALEIAKQNNLYLSIADACIVLSSIYQTLDVSKAFDYSMMAIAAKDSLYELNQKIAFENLTDFDEQERQYELDAAKASYQNQQRLNIFLGSTFTLLVIAFFLYRNNRQKQKSKLQIEGAYYQLKSTQAQLIQSEKMASLGELTAGIAHEIQNPLNFVNNFSEVSGELVDEMNAELEKGDIEEAKFIGKDLKDNLSKITLHGKRADAIVKGMLEHSKKGSGQKELTDINALADEFLRLSYQSFLAKEPEFKAELKTDFDPNLPKLSVIPQDIGRVLLNLINNAFYTINEKTKSGKTDSDYNPIVTVSSAYSPLQGGKGGRVEISVQDNGNGIPDSIKEKIFQPFFTTKPTGSGTGLGLSLSYDIVKAHGGELRVQSDESIGTKFILTLNT